MITRENKDLADWALEYALKNGCSDARIIIYTGTNNSFDFRDTKLDKLEQSSENRMGFHLYVDGRFASYSTNRLERQELEKFILQGIEITRYLAKDEFRKLPDSSRYYKGNGDDLDLFDRKIDSVSVDEKLDLLKESINEVYETDSRIISISAGYEDGINSAYVVNSKGFKGESERTYYNIGVSVSMQGEGDARPSDSWYESSISFDKLKKKGVGKTAYERTLRKLGQEKIESGVYTMIVDNLTVSRLFSPIISAIYGSSIQQKHSFLINKKEEKVLSEKITVIDDPHIKNARGARWFDSEGVATRKMNVFEKGVLKTYYIDTYYAGKLGMEPTIDSPSILFFELGNRNFDEMLASIDKGIWVTGFNGGNSNSTTGDFSFGIEGFLVEKGKATKPLNEMNITGNLLTLWQNIEEVGNDPRPESSWRIPSIVFDKVSFSGK
ncbi:TldD/PmbA family protein [Bacteroidales bacterium OttesenSCG-928-M11]|nr:TldD/PmbA family protein [Bacteroidales bacterium OttesenSCG-928-M11]